MTLVHAGGQNGGVIRSTDVVPLSDERARAATLVGAKAANLAIALHHGLPVLGGAVISTEGVREWVKRGPSADHHDMWASVSRGGTVPLVVRSSSTVEDAEESSKAGRFTSVLRVSGWAPFVDAVGEVIDSATAVDEPAPMAVLVQPWLEAAMGGVAFGADPVTGDDEVVASFVNGGPDTLVSGQEQGEMVHLDRYGRDRSRRRHQSGTTLSRRELRALNRLVRRTGELFEGPQDVEWAVDADRRLWLLQSRPITAKRTAAKGPRFGPGPLAETFPDQLAPLEEDLWLPAVRDGIAQALVLSGARRSRQVERSQVVASVGGRPAVDLDLIGAAPVRRRWWAALDPRPGARRLAASWRVGRLRSALPKLAEQLVYDVDESLLDVPTLSDLDDDALLLILHNARDTLRALHGHEVLIGMLLPTDVNASSVASGALAAVQKARAAGRNDEEIIRRDPIVLALVAPRVGPQPSLPPTAAVTTRPTEGVVDRDATIREALRLRIRWVHELTARAAWELATRLSQQDRLYQPRCARDLTLDELTRLVEGGVPPTALRDRLLDDVPALPAVFRLREDGTVAALDVDTAALGAGGGRAEGLVHIGDDPPSGAVLVAEALTPELAWVLPNLNGLIVETGSPLSHLAILAREAGVATVVAYPDAMNAFAPGERVLVDGSTGEVTRLEEKGGTASAADNGDRMTAEVRT